MLLATCCHLWNPKKYIWEISLRTNFCFFQLILDDLQECYFVLNHTKESLLSVETYIALKFIWMKWFFIIKFSAEYSAALANFHSLSSKLNNILKCLFKSKIHIYSNEEKWLYFAFIIVCWYLHLQVYENNQIFEGWRNKFPSILMIPLFTQRLSLLRKHSMFTKKYKTTVQPRYFSSKILHNMQCTYEIIPSNKYHVSCCRNTNERQANRRHWRNLMIKVVRPI